MMVLISSIGIVPKPNMTINKIPWNALCMAVAPANATYTMLHGNTPFKVPARIFEEIVSENINGEIIFLSHDDAKLFVNLVSIDGDNLMISITDSIDIPATREMFC